MKKNYTPYEARELAIHASSVWSGMTFGNQEERAINAWDQGCYELHAYVAQVAELLYEIDCALYAALGDDGFPGSLTYEVSEPVGSQLVERAFPDERTLKQLISRLVVDFCRHGDEKSVEIGKQVTAAWLNKE